MRYIFSIVLLSLTWPLAAQDRLLNDSSKYKFLPTGVRIGTDLLAIGKSFATDYYKGGEVNFDADIYRRYYVAVDYGSSQSDFSLGNGVYGNKGTYYRIGVDVNFLLKDPDRNMFFIGIRHGHASYTDYTEYSYTDSYGRPVNLYAANQNASANWKELTTGLRVKVWRFVWLGATARVKVRLRPDGQEDLLSYEVPGYGRTIKNQWWGINYQIFIRIPTRPD